MTTVWQTAAATFTSHTVIWESAEPVTILSSRRLPWRPHTLSWWASSVFTHSLVLIVHSFTKPSEPLRRRCREIGTEHQGLQCQPSAEHIFFSPSTLTLFIFLVKGIKWKRDYLVRSWVPRLTKMTFRTEASWPSKVLKNNKKTTRVSLKAPM